MVWAKGTGSPAQDRQALAQTDAVVKSLWGPETALMGKPLPDVGQPAGARHGHAGGDDGNQSNAIDVYAVGPHDSVRRGGREDSLDVGDVALANSVPASALNGHPHGRSGYLLVQRARLGAAGFKSDVAHEFFHVLQYAHNIELPHRCGPQGNWWFTEASATWAEAYFVPRTAAKEVFSRFLSFQDGSSPVASWGMEATKAPADAYSSFIWPYFMQQEAGPATVADVWKATDHANKCADLTGALDHTFSFKKHFHDFALRNLDDSETFSNGSISPITPRYQALHADFPDAILPSRIPVELTPTTSSQPPTTESIEIPALRAWYYNISVGGGVGQISVDTTQLDPQGGFNIDAVEHADGRWKVEHLSPGHAKICVDPGATLDEVYLVVSNHSTDATRKLTGDVDLRALAESCGCPDYTSVRSFQGTASLTFSASTSGSDSDGNSERISLSHFSGPLQAKANAVASDTAHSAFAGPVTSGTVSVHDSDSFTDAQGNTSTAAADAATQVDAANSSADINFDPRACSYTVGLTATAPTQYSSTGDSPRPGPDSGISDQATSPVTEVHGSLSLSGSVQVPVFETQPTDVPTIFGGFATVFFLPDESWGAEYLNVAGSGAQGRIGTATFTWNFSPSSG